MKTSGTIIFCLFLSIHAFSIPPFQEFKDNFADSLEVKLILEDPENRISILNKLSEHYVKNFPGKAMEKAREAYNLSQSFNKREEEVRALRNIGKSFQHLTANYDSALYYCLEALKISEAKGFKKETIETNIAIANIYTEVGNYSKSIDFLTQGEIVATELKLFRQKTDIKILRAKNLVNLELTSEALEELRSALKICKLHNLLNSEGKVRLALGEYYLTYSSPELSMENINLAQEIFQTQGDKSDKATALFDMAQWHLTFGKEEEAIKHFRECLQMHKALGNLHGIAECYFFIGLCFNKLSDYEAAIETLENCRNLAEKINAKRILRRCYNQFFLAYSSIDDLEKAIEFRDLYAAITELIFAEENERQIAEQQARFDIEKKDQELAIQSERLERERNFNLVLTLLVIILLGSAIFIFILFRQNKLSNQKIKEINIRILEQNQQLKNLNDTKNKFFSIIGHDIKGPLASLTSFLNLLKNHIHHMSQEEIVSVATDLDKSVKNLQSLLENVLTWAMSQTGNIDIKPENTDMAQLIRENFALLGKQAANKNIEMNLIDPGPVFCKVDRNTISTAVRNLISNAIKFTHEYGKIDVKIEEWKDAVEVSVKDNGIGIPPEVLSKIFDIGSKYSTQGTKKEKGTGLGLILCKEFVEKNEGKLSVTSKVGEGSVFLFTLPKNSVH